MRRPAPPGAPPAPQCAGRSPSGFPTSESRRVARRPAIPARATAAGADGSDSTIGVPASPDSRTRVSSGTWPSSGTVAPISRVSDSATIAPPPLPKISIRCPSGSSSQDMFSTTPISRWWVCDAIPPARSATSAAAIWGVVTTRISALGSNWASEIAMSPVPGGRSSSSTSRSPQYTSARNCWSARCSIGPRHTTGVLFCVNMPIEITFTPCACGGMIMSSTRVGRSDAPSIRGIEWP